MDWLLCDEGLSGVGRREARVIAVVVDEESFRDALWRFLRAQGFQVEASGRERSLCGRATWTWSRA
jgi:hypothetical protein